jgi:predicted kinase
MRRLPADRMLPALLARDAASPAMIDELARLVARFHARADHGPDIAAHASPDAVRTRWTDTMTALGAAAGDTLSRAQLALLTDFGPRFVATHAELFRARQAQDRVRDGHGDLHAEHVCIYVFDCIEFSPAFRCNDVAAEVAFLTMDLEHRGRRDLAERFAHTYADAAHDPQLPGLLPFYASARAAVRALVDTLTSQEAEVDAAERSAAAERARRHLALAVRCAWRAQAPLLIACAGRSGTGKSTVAADLAGLVDATVLRSDVIRKRGGASTTAAARYSPAARAAVYLTLAADADAALAAGHSVIADATFLRRADRDRLRAVAARREVPCVFLECRTDAARARDRLAARGPEDPSDARWDTYLAQAGEEEPFAPEEAAIVLATDDARAAVTERALEALWAWCVRERSGR